MSTIDADAVRRAARLARIHITEAEAIDLARELDEVRDWVDRLQAVDVSEVSPLFHPHHDKTTLRADVSAQALTQTQVLANGPHVDEGHFVVPRVVG